MQDVQQNQMYMPSAKSIFTPDASPQKIDTFLVFLSISRDVKVEL